MSNKEATARIKINKLLEAAGWRFFADDNAPANIRLEPTVALKPADLDALGENFEKPAKGFVDFLLLDARGFPLIVLEAKAEDKNPLVGKEQARRYARSQNCRFVLLSNGNLHYFWDLERGNPYLITAFPTPSASSRRSSKPTTSSAPSVPAMPPRPPGRWRPSAPASSRPTGCASWRVLFLVDRLGLEDQAKKALSARAIEAGRWERAVDTVNREVLNKPEEFYTLDKLRRAAAVDRRLTLREILEKVFGLIPRFKSKDELLEEEFAKFVTDARPTEAEAIPAIKTFFKAYVTSDQVRAIIEARQFTDLATNPVFSTRD